MGLFLQGLPWTENLGKSDFSLQEKKGEVLKFREK
jgi:hypothetical protein